MRTLSDSDLLAAWEKGRENAPGIAGVLALLAAAYPAESLDSIARLSIGGRDALLLELREQLFGSHIQGLTNCSVCHQPLEITLLLSDLKLDFTPPASNDLTVHVESYDLEFRLPNSFDLLEIESAPSIEAGRSKLLERVIISAFHQDEPISASALPDHIVELVEDKMAEVEPQADLQLKASCSHCRNMCSTVFDISSFLWKEVDAWAVRVLREIHALAAAYGWREADILAMSPYRRRCYMEMLGA